MSWFKGKPKVPTGHEIEQAHNWNDWADGRHVVNQWRP